MSGRKRTPAELIAALQAGQRRSPPFELQAEHQAEPAQRTPTQPDLFAPRFADDAPTDRHRGPAGPLFDED